MLVKPARSPMRQVASRRPLALFVLVMLVLSGQLIWWMAYQIRSINTGYRNQVALLETKRQWAQQLLPSPSPLNGSVQQAKVAQFFPELVWRASAQTMEVRPDILPGLAQRRSRLIRMFVAESAFFWLMVGLGAVLVVRTLRQETALLHQQQNFLAAVTHELKSPLAAIRLQAETLLLRDPPGPIRQRYLRCIRLDVQRLDGLVGNLLAAARLDSGDVLGQQRRLDLVAEVDHVAAEVGLAWQQARENVAGQNIPSALDMQLPPGPLMVCCDSSVVRTVVRNLLSNAAKYGGAAPVQLVLEQAAGWVHLQVIDQGIGLAPEEQPRVFTKFYRVGHELERQTEGSGLGLYLVDALLQQSGGRAGVRSAGLGKGCTFTASFPVAPAVGIA
jgi:two-component system phosphate regulon sensor histidine kinase PhoR